MAIADIQHLQKELKSDVLPEMWTKGNTLVNRIMSGSDKEQMNNRAYLLQRFRSLGGDLRSQTFDAAAYAAGTNPFTDQMSVSPTGVAISFSATELMQFATRNDRVAINNFMAWYNSRMMEGFKEQMESMLNANSNDGIADILSGVQNTTEYLLQSADSLYAGYLLVPGASYQIIASASFPNTIRATGPYRVLPGGAGLNRRGTTPFVQFAASNGSSAAAITGFTAEDRVVWFGFGNAGFPSIGYLVSSAVTGTVQGVNRSDHDNQPTRIDGGGNAVTAGLVRRLYADIYKYKGTSNSTDGLLPYCSQEQRVNWLNSADAVTEIRLTDAGGAGIGEIYDRFLGDVKVDKKSPLISSKANPTQFRFVRLSDFVWLTLKPIGFLEGGDIGHMHRQHDSSGDILSAFTIVITFDGTWAIRDFTGQGVLFNLAKPQLGD